MRLTFVMVVSLVAACAFDPAGPGGRADDDSTDSDATTASDLDAISVTDPDAATASDPDAADPSTVTDASLPLPDASLPLPDAAPPVDAPPPIDAPPATENACTNGDDDDDDGKTDCRDDDCPGCGGLTSCCASGACAVICL